MRFSFITIGSRGDVQPFIALGKGLQRKGHSVQICAMNVFQDYIESEGFKYAFMAGSAELVMEKLIGEQVSFVKYFKNLKGLLEPIKSEFLTDIENACKDADCVLYSTLGSVAYHVCEKFKIPCFRVFFCPLDPTGEFPAMTAPRLPLGKIYNRFTFKSGDLLWSHATRTLLNDWRTAMGLAPIKRFQFPYREIGGKLIPTLYAYSPTLAPKPKEWDDCRYVTGFWIQDIFSNWEPQQELIKFLQSGEKPVYIGFGSTVGGDFNRMLDVVLESLQRTKQRALLSAGWRHIGNRELPANVMLIDNVPHEWLFRQVKAVSHHGGAGTTAAGIRAGVPSVIVPFGGDQPYWGDRVYQLGIGTKPIWCKKLTAERYAQAINIAVSDEEMQKRAAAFGKKLRDEDGVAKAIAVIENNLGL
ncbi:MAG: glycosyltransferase [Clostridiaceae bacterium]|nr:glycosyltransferase [Clostridiaceae bacterium]